MTTTITENKTSEDIIKMGINMSNEKYFDSNGIIIDEGMYYMEIPVLKYRNYKLKKDSLGILYIYVNGYRGYFHNNRKKNILQLLVAKRFCNTSTMETTIYSVNKIIQVNPNPSIL